MKFKKFYAVITAICFLWSFTGQSFATLSEDIGSTGKTVFENDSLISGSLGYVSRSGSYGSPQVIINIQDLHCHPVVQKNIVSIIETIDKKYNINTIYLEGASGKVDVSWLAKIDNEKSKKNIADQMILDGNLTGVEYYALFNKNKNIIGLEDSQIHKQNIERLGRIYDNEDKYKEISYKIKKEIDYLARKYLSSESRNFTNLTAKYRAGTISQAKYYMQMFKMADKINSNPDKYGNILQINKSDYTELQKIINISKISEKIKQARLKAEISAYISDLKSTLPYSEYNKLLSATDQFRDLDSLCEYISFYGVDESKQQLKAFVVLNRMNAEIDPVAIFLQEENLQEKINAAFATNEMQTDISFLQTFYPFFEGYLTNALTPQDEEFFAEKYEMFNTIYAKYAAVDHILLLQDNFNFLNEYYSTNNLRNEIFIKNIDKHTKLVPGKLQNNDPVLNIVGDAEEIIVVVTGGYHTKGMSDILNSKRISNITITPRTSGDIDGALLNYKQVIMEQSRFFKESLAFAVASQMPVESQYYALTEASIKLFAGVKISPEDVKELVEALNAAENEAFGNDSESVLSNRFKAVTNGAFKFIEGLDYSMDNIKELADAIEIITGPDSLQLRFIDDKNSEIEFSNGTKISFAMGKDGKIIKGGTFAQVQEEENLTTLNMSDFARFMFENGFDLASMVDINNDKTYKLIKKILLFAVMSEKDYLKLDVSGPIPAIVEKYEGKNIDGIPYELISKMPEFFQHAAFARQKATDDILGVGTVTKSRSFISMIKRAIFVISLIVVLITLKTSERQKDLDLSSPPAIYEQVDNSASGIITQDGRHFIYKRVAEVKENYEVYESMFIKDDEGYSRFYVIDENGKMIFPNIKGIAYAPSAEDRSAYAKNYKKDLPEIAKLGGNFIRTYYLFAAYDSNGNIDYEATREMLDYTHSLGIKVMVGVAYDEMQAMNFDEYLREVGNHPAIALFGLGNEYDVPAQEEKWGFNMEDLYNRLAEGAECIKRSGVKKAYATASTDVPKAAEIERYDKEGIPVIPNLYRGKAINLRKSEYPKVVGIIGEYGSSAIDDKGNDIRDEQAENMEYLANDMIRLIEENRLNGGFFFQYRQDFVKDWGAREKGFGLIDVNGKPLPVAKVFTNAMNKVPDGYYTNIEEVRVMPTIETKQAEPEIIANELSHQHQETGDNWAALFVSLEGDISVGNTLTVNISGTPNTNIYAELKDPSEDPNYPGILVYEGTTDEKGNLTFEVLIEEEIRTDFVISYGLDIYGKKLNDTNDAEMTIIEITKLELEKTRKILDKLNFTGKARAIAAAVLELPYSLFLSPEKFAEMHFNETEEQRIERQKGAEYIKKATYSGIISGLLAGAVLSTVSIISLGVSTIVGAFAVIGAVSFMTTLTFAITKNILAHFRWNYRTFTSDINIIYTDEARLAKAKSVFGTKIRKIGDNRISAPVYIINEVADRQDFIDNYKNTGLKIEGSTVWVRKDTENGIIFFAEGVEREKISELLQQGRLRNIVRDVMDEQKLSMPGQMTVDAVEINSLGQSRNGFEYNNLGNPYVYVDINTGTAEMSSVLFDQVRTVAKAEAWTYAQKYMIFLDNTDSPAEFDRYIKNILGKASNGNIIINATLANALYDQNKLASTIALLREDGISIMVESSVSDTISDEIKNMVDGIYNRDTWTIENPMNLIFEEQSAVIIDETVINFQEAVESARGAVIIYESAMGKYLENDRSGFAKFILDLWTSPKTLKNIFSEPITAENAGETARNLDTVKIIQQFEGLSIDKVKELNNKYSISGDIVSALSDEFGLNNAAGKYLERIAAQAQDKQEIQNINDAFAEGLIEKLLAAAALKEKGNNKGIKNKKVEKVLGKLLAIQYIMPQTTIEGEKEIIDDLHNSNGSTYMEKINALLHNKDHISTKVAEAAAEMIMVFSKEIEFEESMKPTVTNTQAISKILSAA